MSAEGFVYFALHEDDQRHRGLVKIGWAKSDPARRIAELQTGNPFRLNYLGSLPGPREAEQWVHEQLSHHRVAGEWFELGDAWEVIPFWTLVEGVRLGDVVGFIRDALDGAWDEIAAERMAA